MSAALEVAAVVFSLISAFRSGVDVVNRVRDRRRIRRRQRRQEQHQLKTNLLLQNPSKVSSAQRRRLDEDEARLTRSLGQAPEEIEREYERDLAIVGNGFAEGDVIARASLADILLRLNTGLVNIISSFLLSTDDAAVLETQLDYKSLIRLSEDSRNEALAALGGLYRRMSTVNLKGPDPGPVIGLRGPIVGGGGSSKPSGRSKNNNDAEVVKVIRIEREIRRGNPRGEVTGAWVKKTKKRRKKKKAGTTEQTQTQSEPGTSSSTTTARSRGTSVSSSVAPQSASSVAATQGSSSSSSSSSNARPSLTRSRHSDSTTVSSSPSRPALTRSSHSGSSVPSATERTRRPSTTANSSLSSSAAAAAATITGKPPPPPVPRKSSREVTVVRPPVMPSVAPARPPLPAPSSIPKKESSVPSLPKESPSVPPPMPPIPRREPNNNRPTATDLRKWTTSIYSFASDSTALGIIPDHRMIEPFSIDSFYDHHHRPQDYQDQQHQQQEGLPPYSLRNPSSIERSITRKPVQEHKKQMDIEKKPIQDQKNPDVGRFDSDDDIRIYKQHSYEREGRSRDEDEDEVVARAVERALMMEYTNTDTSSPFSDEQRRAVGGFVTDGSGGGMEVENKSNNKKKKWWARLPFPRRGSGSGNGQMTPTGVLPVGSS